MATDHQLGCVLNSYKHLQKIKEILNEAANAVAFFLLLCYDAFACIRRQTAYQPELSGDLATIRYFNSSCFQRMASDLLATTGYFLSQKFPLTVQCTEKHLQEILVKRMLVLGGFD